MSEDQVIMENDLAESLKSFETPLSPEGFGETNRLSNIAYPTNEPVGYSVGWSHQDIVKGLS